MARFKSVNDRGFVVGEDHHRAKLTDHDVELVLYLRNEEGWTYAQIAAKMEVGRTTVANICRYRTRAQTVMGQTAAPSRYRYRPDRPPCPARPEEFDEDGCA
jgi:hypothetical protein